MGSIAPPAAASRFETRYHAGEVAGRLVQAVRCDGLRIDVDPATSTPRPARRSTPISRPVSPRPGTGGEDRGPHEDATTSQSLLDAVEKPHQIVGPAPALGWGEDVSGVRVLDELGARYAGQEAGGGR